MICFDGPVAATRLAAHAAYVLRANDTGTLTTAAPRLYPHLWSWDAAFVAIGLATVSVPRAIAELETVLEGQWSTGKLPHIVFTQDTSYFPGPDVWRCDLAPTAPSVATSGICQPPVHAIAVARVLQAGRRIGGTARQAVERFVERTFDRWLAWHRWLAKARDPDCRGLIEIYHGWESGMDNSPRWDDAYSRLDAEHVAIPRRHDVLLVDPSERPTDLDYRRYVWLIEQMRQAHYDDDLIRDTVDFRMTDVFMSAIAAVANEVLAEIATELGRTDESAELTELAGRFRLGVVGSISQVSGLARDQNLHTDEWLETDTIAGFAPLICGADEATMLNQTNLITGPGWSGDPLLRFALPPSTSTRSPAFQPRNYWRGPQWPVVTWLLSWALARHGQHGLANQLRAQSIKQLGDLTFGEYYEPYTGESLGSSHQSWTAAVALDWVAGWSRKHRATGVRRSRQPAQGMKKKPTR